VERITMPAAIMASFDSTAYFSSASATRGPPHATAAKVRVLKSGCWKSPT
jgi:hypothetical protein